MCHSKLPKLSYSQKYVLKYEKEEELEEDTKKNELYEGYLITKDMQKSDEKYIIRRN